MSDEVIDPNGIPQFTGDLEQLERDIADLRREASHFRDAGGDVHSDFQGLSAFYEAPEAEQLFATTKPVKTKSDAFADDLEKVGQALSDYASDVRPLAKTLERLKTEASAFYLDDVAMDDDWRKDEDKVAHNNRLMDQVEAAVLAFQAAERACHNKITALVNGIQLKASSDGETSCGTYGYTADVLDQSEKLPWGAMAERDYDGLEWLAHKAKDFAKGVVVDGIVGSVKAIGTLGGADGWGAAGEAWTNLAKLATGVTLSMSPAAGLFWTAKDEHLPGWLRDSRRAVVETGKGLIAYDQWSKNPARAAGLVGFNALMLVATRGAGAAVRGGAAAKTVAVVSKVGRAVDPFTYAAKGVSFAGAKVGDLMTGLKNLRAGGTHIDLPDGRYRLADDGARLPARPDSVPDSAQAFTDAKGNAIYMTRGGAIVDEHGRVLGRMDEAGQGPKESPAADRAAAERAAETKDATPPALRAADQQPVLAGVHGSGSWAGVSGRVGDDMPGGATHGPGGSAADLPGRGASDDLGRRLSASHDTPTGTGREGAGTPTGEHRSGGGHADDGMRHPGSGDGAGHGAHPHGGDHGHAGDAGQAPGSHADSASVFDEGYAPEEALVRDGSLPGAGPGDKYLGQLDESRIARDDNGLITHVDGHPLADHLQALSRDRAEVYIQAKNDGSFPKTQTGACVGVVVDRRTGQVFEGINGPGDALIALDDLHPTLMPRYEQLMAETPPHPAPVLEHAEVKAVNRLLWERRKLGMPDDAGALRDMRASVYFPFKKDFDLDVPVPPKSAPFCANCARMLHDVPSNAGRFPNWPAKSEERQPW